MRLRRKAREKQSDVGLKDIPANSVNQDDASPYHDMRAGNKTIDNEEQQDENVYVSVPAYNDDAEYVIDPGRLYEAGQAGSQAQDPMYVQDPGWTNRELPVQVTPSADNVHLGKTLGEGFFGSVKHGMFLGRDVAVKVIPDASVSDLDEAKLMQSLQHENIVALFGQYLCQNQLFIVMELLPMGSLLDVIRDMFTDDQTLSNEHKLSIAIQVASAMQYLAANQIVHRDLSARNVLLKESDPGFIAKVSDFGLSRRMQDTDYYTSSSQVNLPLRWLAPECFQRSVFSIKSDVWAFGVTMYELWSDGMKPYFQLDAAQVLSDVPKGSARLPRPESCPHNVWQLVETCLHLQKSQRPNFQEIVHRLENMDI